ncbi:PA2169 family four-helix-bundle protein [Dyella sedimenti]|uniref:PA2169 family four-helix-bundle protein n=1 Tax=Dyella sedimenti TaxID=2919947 RepID=UPI001FA9EE72|nr:PA2169 family four-helix-bundle protein [Dyella sedimenti]
MTSNDHDVRMLNRLVEVTIDSMLGYAEAAKETQNAQFKELFDQRSTERQRVASRLQEQVRQLGGTPADEGSLAASVHRVFVDLRAALSKGDQAVVDEVERGEDHIKSKYEEALKDESLSTPTRQVIQDTYQLVLRDHDQMRDIKHGLQRSA